MTHSYHITHNVYIHSHILARSYTRAHIHTHTLILNRKRTLASYKIQIAFCCCLVGCCCRCRWWWCIFFSLVIDKVFSVLCIVTLLHISSFISLSLDSRELILYFFSTTTTTTIVKEKRIICIFVRELELRSSVGFCF